MQKKVTRSYELHDRDIREAIIAWLRAKDLPAPIYVGDTPDCKWIKRVEGIGVEWTEEAEIN